jgi:hypothetical protein
MYNKIKVKFFQVANNNLNKINKILSLHIKDNNL